jgi:quercetin dioxygenase-like cupin family protein
MSTSLPVVTPWGSGDVILGTPFRTVVSTEATLGGLVMLTIDMEPGVHVDEHVHDAEDQIIVVISGRAGVQVDGVKAELTDGGIAFVPRGSAHSVWNDSDDVARCLEIYTPGGMEQFFAMAGARSEDNQATAQDYQAARR